MKLRLDLKPEPHIEQIRLRNYRIIMQLPVDLSVCVQVRQQSLAGTTLRLQLPRPACPRRGCSPSPSRLLRQDHRHRVRGRARASRHRTKPSSTPLCPLATDTLVWALQKGRLALCFSLHRRDFSNPSSPRTAVLRWCARGPLSLPVRPHRLRASCLSEAAGDGPGQPLQPVPPTASAQLRTARLRHG